ncbi:MAG: diaminopimelate decarboxylase, partial [Clostridia bacterium]|nr:diaminopimelate decarboxylase [Clostridia bacterium]
RQPAVPRHVAIIMDGNGRWAKSKGLPRIMGPRQGAQRVLDVFEAAAKAGVKQKILLRVTPGIDPHTHKKISTGGVDSKFGSAIATGDAENVTRLALSLANVELCGFHCHIGSQLFDITPFIDAVDIMTSFIARVKQVLGYEAGILNLGGGIGVRYVKDDPFISVTESVKKISSALFADCAAKGIRPPAVMLEPGRSIVADSGITLYTVGSVKEIKDVKNYVSVDGGMTDNPRYTLYQAAYTVMNASKAASEPDFTCTLCGRCCESGDILQENVRIPRPARGDIIAVLTTGAYNYSMASNYNRIPRPPVVLVSGGKTRVAVRRETYEDLVNCDE